MDALRDESKKFVIEKASRGYDADEIRHLLKEQKDLAMAPSASSIREFMESEEGQEEIEVRESVRQKKSEVTKEELVETLVDLKDELVSWQDELKDTEHGVTRNEAINNQINVVNKIGELIGELDQKGVSKNVVKIDELNQHIEQEITQVVKYLRPEQKKDIIEQLEEDDDIEDYIIKRAKKDEEDEQEEDKEEDEEEKEQEVRASTKDT